MRWLIGGVLAGVFLFVVNPNLTAGRAALATVLLVATIHLSQEKPK